MCVSLCMCMSLSVCVSRCVSLSVCMSLCVSLSVFSVQNLLKELIYMNLVIDTVAQDNYLISGLCFISLVWILLPIYIKLYKKEGIVIFCA